MSKKAPKPYKSLFEWETAKFFKKHKVAVEYEPFPLEYTLAKKYHPDWLLPNGIIIETKGKLDADDKAKMRAVKKFHPHLDIRIVFQNANNKVRKGSKTTYGEWATKAGYLWASGTVPKAWLKEKKH